MGCGGSRADALEPRYLESWTRDTESTWLTGSDTDAGPDAGALEDGPSPSGVPRATVTSGISNLEKKMNCGIQSLSSGPLAQKQNGLWGTQLLLPGFTPNFSIQVRLSLSQVQCILLETRARKQQLSEVCSHNYQYDGNPRGQGQLPEHVSAHLLSTSIPVANASQRGEPHTSKVGGRAEN
ncbi:brain and acute leukemia cytoplasmic protein isoform X3 [Heterocephalus glaber]|uniref:Brain and acute leukemia cytoplasmic protein isoform X3 n=1 Tax=Heterocephalus glaber TaxID=10181 RepID=A0AAX6PEZ0_HETGA|nr:brain and acute leukemia cytoplasmic protein isoform X3 [Heterocephalus glaber]